MPVSVRVPVLVLELTVAAKSDLLLDRELRILELIAAPTNKSINVLLIQKGRKTLLGTYV